LPGRGWPNLQLGRGALARAAFEAAPFYPAQWEVGLDLFALAGGGWAGQLLAVRPGGEIAINLVTQMTPSAVTEWEQRGGAIVGVNPRALSMLTDRFAITADDDFLSRAAQDRSPFYRDVFRPFDADFISVGKLGTPEKGLQAIAGVIRSRRQGHAGRTDHERIARLLPHVDAALRMTFTLGRRDVRVTIDALDAMGLAGDLRGGRAICEVGGRIVAITRAAEALLHEGRLVVARQGRLAAAEAAQDERLQAAIRRACARGRAGTASRMGTLLISTPAGPPRRVDVAPLPQGHVRAVSACIVTIAAPPPVPHPATLLRTMFLLTRAEAEIAIDVARGLSSHEIALRRGVGVTTVRGQVHAVHQKMGVNKASALAALLGRLSLWK
jgi:DNA-binding CsgD family transcriptional regulator